MNYRSITNLLIFFGLIFIATRIDAETRSDAAAIVVAYFLGATIQERAHWIKTGAWK
jgi:hypothetical protein